MVKSVALDLARTINNQIEEIPTVVIAPAIGAITLGHHLAYSLEVVTGHSVEFIYTEQGQLRRGFEIETADRVILVDDVVSTGNSLREIDKLVQVAGAKTIAWTCAVNRSGLDLISWTGVGLELYSPDSCPQCQVGLVPLEKPGSRGHSN
jgi:orotate phosphoribosyltransferase